MGGVWQLTRDSVLAYIDDEALSRGAAMSYYTVTSFAPVLLIVIAIAGLVFGEDAARGAIVGQVQGLMGVQAAAMLQSVLRSASDQSTGTLAGLVGLGTLIVTASGVFSEMQSALNAVWRAQPQGTAMSRLVRARLLGLGLVAALGFLLLVSLVITAGLTALGHWLDGIVPAASLLLQLVTFLVSFGLLALIFAGIYKVLPDRRLAWRDVLVGAVVTAFLFTVGKSLIGLYLGSSSMASSYGAAGGLLILLVWVYYSSQIFLLGAEFTKVYATRHGSFRDHEIARTIDKAVAGRPTTRQKRVIPQRP
jgi:membrane protein